MLNSYQILIISLGIIFSSSVSSKECVNYFTGGSVFFLQDLNSEPDYQPSKIETRINECLKRFQNVESSEIDDIISHTYLMLRELPSQESFESITPLLEKIKSSALNGYHPAEIFFLSIKSYSYDDEDFKPGNIYWDYIFNTQQEIFKNLDKSRQSLADYSNIYLDSIEDYEKQLNILQSINFYQLPTIFEKLLFLSYSLELTEFDNSNLKKITEYFLYHFDNDGTNYIDDFELSIYTNFIYHLLNSDNSQYINLIESKLRYRLGINDEQSIDLALLNLTYLSDDWLDDFLIFTLILNFQSQQFSEYPYSFEFLMEKRDFFFDRLKERNERFISAFKENDTYTEELAAIMTKFADLHVWISDSAIKFHDYPITGNCKKALILWDEYINLFNNFKKHIPDYEDFDMYTEMLFAANCAIKANDASLKGVQQARNYYLLSSENKNPRADKFEQLFYKLMDIKILFYDSSINGHKQKAFKMLSDINDQLFSKEFYLKSFRQTEFFDRSITIYSMLYSYFIDLKWENLSDLTHPLEWTDLKQALINNNSLSQLNSSSNSKLTSNLQESLQSINLEISILEKSFIDSSESNTFMKLQEKFIEKQNIVNRIFAVNQNLKDFVTYDNTHFDEFRSNLEENSYILAVHFGHQDSYGYLVSRNSSKIIYIPANKHEASWSFARFNEEIQANDIAELSKSSTILYRRFFKDLLDDVPEGATIFLYGDEFNHIPMNALSIRYKEKDSDYERMLSTEWLIKKYKFSHIEPYYSYSDAKRKYQEEFLGIAIRN